MKRQMLVRGMLLESTGTPFADIKSLNTVIPVSLTIDSETGEAELLCTDSPEGEEEFEFKILNAFDSDNFTYEKVIPPVEPEV